MLTGLRSRAVRSRHHEDAAVHLGCARDHVLDVVRVTRAVDVSVVPVLRLVLNVRGGDGDAALALLGGVIDLLEGLGEPPYVSERTLVMAAVSVVLPWST